jgi:hypothetical protein
MTVQNESETAAVGIVERGAGRAGASRAEVPAREAEQR